MELHSKIVAYIDDGPLGELDDESLAELDRELEGVVGGFLLNRVVSYSLEAETRLEGFTPAATDEAPAASAADEEDTELRRAELLTAGVNSGDELALVGCPHCRAGVDVELGADVAGEPGVRSFTCPACGCRFARYSAAWLNSRVRSTR